MNWEQALSEIQSHEFAANLNVVSSMGTFFRAASREPAVVALYRAMLESGEACEETLGQIYDLSRLQVAPRYENPSDTPLAILLWLINFAAPAYKRMAASLVDRAPQCWYAKKLARRIIMPPPVASGDAWVGERPSTFDIAKSSSGDMIIIMSPPDQKMKFWHYMEANADQSTTSNEPIGVVNWK